MENDMQTLVKKFKRQKDVVEMADAGTGCGLATETDFVNELEKMELVQQHIKKELFQAQQVVNELEPIVNSFDWQKMSLWIKKYSKNKGLITND